MLTHGSLFAGIGGFDLGFDRAGIETLWTVENDKNCNAILEKHWPDMKRYGDVKDVGKRNLAPVDIISGGFPCQDLSVAGRRAGLAGGRSGLWYEFARIIEEMEAEWVVVENVPGLFSSNGGADFAVIIRTLGLFGYCVAWRVLDSQYFGVPQRRRRVFIIGSLGNGSAVKVLFESEGGEGDIAEGKEERQRVTDSTISCALTGCKTATGRLDPNEQTFVVDSPTFSDKAACLYSAYGTKWNGNRAADDGSLFAFQQNQRDEVREMDVAGAIAAEPGVHQQNYVVARTNSTKSCGDGILEDGTVHSVAGGSARDVVAYTVNTVDDGRKDRPEGGMYVKEVDKALTPRSKGQNYICHEIHGGSKRKDRPEGGFYVREMETTKPLDTSGLNPACAQGGVMMGVRRLTPTECERLQGFPDGWTEGLSDSARYRCLGNAVTVSVAEWIGKRLIAT